MSIIEKKVVTIEYTLTNSEGEVLDSTVDQDPLEYLHGYGNIIDGLEEALTGKKVGEKFKIEVEPERGYGVRDDALVQEVPNDAFSEVEDLKEGMELYAENDGEVQMITVLKVADETVTIDQNHPLAGQVLHFEVTVKSIRDATADEIEHGHVHNAEGCGH